MARVVRRGRSLELPPLDRPDSEGGSQRPGSRCWRPSATVAYAVAAARYWFVYRGRLALLQASVIACFVLLAEAMIGVALTGERAWHASWWVWHALIVTAYAVVSYAARRQWRDERFRALYLPTTRERGQSVSVLFSDLAGFTAFAERAKPAEVASVLNTYYAIAAPLITRRFGGEVEKFMGDGMMATFNTRGDQPDHAVRAAGAALALQRELTGGRRRQPGMASAARRRQQRRRGRCARWAATGSSPTSVVGDTVNTASRLESEAPEGGVLIGARPAGAARRRVVEAVPGVRVKGKEASLDAFLLQALP